MNENVKENVVYSYVPDEEPAVRYHSIPLSCAGAANTLADARASYRADLTGLLHVGKRELPPVTEHVRRCWRTGRPRMNCAPTSIGPAVRASSPLSCWPNRRTPSVRCWNR